jgi:diguanylate cyclase (GGDEF)-like protein
MTDPRHALGVLLDLTRLLTEQRGVQESLAAITEAAVALLPAADHASLRLLDDSRTLLLAGARSGAGEGSREVTFRPGEGVVGWVVEHSELVRLDDAPADPRFAVVGDQGFEIRSLLAVPLTAGGNCVGVLGAISSRTAAFGEDDELLARLLANCAVPPIERARLKLMSLTDHHTRAFNQRFLMPRLREEIDYARRADVPLSLLLLDLDRFKSVNDEHGHAVGDQVLSAFADRLRRVVRRRDVLVRRGGDEFVLIMPKTNAHDALAVARRVLESLEKVPLALGAGRAMPQATSIGVATWRGPDETGEDLERRADEAMYEAKRGGGQRVAVAP